MIEYMNIPEERIRILRRNRKLENELKEFLDARIDVRDDIKIDCDDPIKMLRVKEIIKAFGRGFDVDDAIYLVDEDYFLEVLDVKGFTGKSKRRQITLKGRVIGKKGKTKDIIEKYTGTKISIYGKTVSIIGKWENMKTSREAVEMLLNGASHSSVYHFLEDQKTV